MGQEEGVRGRRPSRAPETGGVENRPEEAQAPLGQEGPRADVGVGGKKGEWLGRSRAPQALLPPPPPGEPHPGTQPTLGAPGALQGALPFRSACRSVAGVGQRQEPREGLTPASPRPDHFQRLLNDSERALQDAFPSAFGELYAQSTGAFRDLYSELRLYYRGANLHLQEALAEFWAHLLEHLFKQLHPQLLLPDDYLDCLGKQAEALRPFGEAPRELRLRATRAFVAARSFVQGLGVASDVVRKVVQVCRTARGSRKHAGPWAAALGLGMCSAVSRRSPRWPPLLFSPVPDQPRSQAGSGGRGAWGWARSQPHGRGKRRVGPVPGGRRG